MMNILKLGGLITVFCFCCSFYTTKNFRVEKSVETKVYNRDGSVLDVNLTVHYFSQDSVLDIYDFRGNLKTVYKSKRYKIKPYDVERLEFTMFGKKHVFYSHTDRLQRLYYFFYAEKDGDLKLLKRKIEVKGGMAMPGMGGISLGGGVSITAGSVDINAYTYSLIRDGEKYVTDIQDGRLTLTFEEYLDDCPSLIKKLDDDEFDPEVYNLETKRINKLRNAVDYYNEHCGTKD